MTQMFPNTVQSGEYGSKSHVQGIAVDTEGGYVYYSFTTMLLKTDLLGRPIGSVVRLAGHLGCISFDPIRRRVYGSLELKHDAIGQGIIARSGWDPSGEDSFYLVSFEADRITHMGMDAERDGVMRAVYLPEVVADYLATDEASGCAHRYGCSGIDGIGYGPVFGTPDGSSKKLMIAYGIYSDTERRDNDYQVLLQLDPAVIEQYGMPLNQEKPHHNGPARSEARYFLYTGNTTYGIQNLEYDPYTKSWLVAVYRGKKDCFANNSLYFIDSTAMPRETELRGREGEVGMTLTLTRCGEDAAYPRGIDFPYGQTGIFAFGDGTYYFSQDGRDRERGVFYTTVTKYQIDFENENLFVESKS